MSDISKEQRVIIDDLEDKGQYVLAESARFVFADKAERRKSKISAINLAANVRDKLENMGKKLLELKVGSGVNSVFNLLESDFDRIEEKMTKVLTDYLEYKSNTENVPDDERTEEIVKEKPDKVEVDKKVEKKEKPQEFKEPKILDDTNIKNVMPKQL